MDVNLCSCCLFACHISKALGTPGPSSYKAIRQVRVVSDWVSLARLYETPKPKMVSSILHCTTLLNAVNKKLGRKY